MTSQEWQGASKLQLEAAGVAAALAAAIDLNQPFPVEHRCRLAAKNSKSRVKSCKAARCSPAWRGPALNNAPPAGRDSRSPARGRL
jgi:hypothetical protein